MLSWLSTSWSRRFLKSIQLIIIQFLVLCYQTFWSKIQSASFCHSSQGQPMKLKIKNNLEKKFAILKDSLMIKDYHWSLIKKLNAFSNQLSMISISTKMKFATRLWQETRKKELKVKMISKEQSPLSTVTWISNSW